jgi:hypothetical protein
MKKQSEFQSGADARKNFERTMTALFRAPKPAPKPKPLFKKSEK